MVVAGMVHTQRTWGQAAVGVELRGKVTNLLVLVKKNRAAFSSPPYPRAWQASLPPTNSAAPVFSRTPGFIL